MARFAMIVALICAGAVSPVRGATPLYGPNLELFAKACIDGGLNFETAHRVFSESFTRPAEEDEIRVETDLVTKSLIWKDERAFVVAALIDYPKVQRCEFEFRHDDSGALWKSLDKIIQGRFSEKSQIIVGPYGPIYRIDAFFRPVFVEIKELSIYTTWEGMMGISVFANKE